MMQHVTVGFSQRMGEQLVADIAAVDEDVLRVTSAFQ